MAAISLQLVWRPGLHIRRSEMAVNWTRCASLKHYNEKETDSERRQGDGSPPPFELIQVRNVVDQEGLHGWQQICASAIKKEAKYAPGFPNILVFVNHSDALDLQLRSALNVFDDAVRKAEASARLRKLSGMMMLKNYQSVGWNATNVEFCYTSYALHGGRSAVRSSDDPRPARVNRRDAR